MKILIAATCASLFAPVASSLAHDPVPETEHRRDVVDTAVAAGTFSTLAQALGAANLVETLKGDGPFTVFAPTDEAFAKLPEDTLAALLQPQNRDALIDVLSYHVVSGDVSAQDAIAAGHAATIQGDSIAFRIESGRLRVNDASVTTNDIDCTNGVVHALDTVLLPPGELDLRPAGRLVIGVNIEKPGRALAEQLEIDRDRTLLLTGVTHASPADRAGLRQYDVVTSIDGKPATDDELRVAKERAGLDGTLALTVIRRGKSYAFTVGVGLDPH